MPLKVDPLFDFVQNNINQRKKERKREKKVNIKIVYSNRLFAIDTSDQLQSFVDPDFYFPNFWLPIW